MGERDVLAAKVRRHLEMETSMAAEVNNNAETNAELSRRLRETEAQRDAQAQTAKLAELQLETLRAEVDDLGARVKLQRDRDLLDQDGPPSQAHYAQRSFEADQLAADVQRLSLRSGAHSETAAQIQRAVEATQFVEGHGASTAERYSPRVGMHSIDLAQDVS